MMLLKKYITPLTINRICTTKPRARKKTECRESALPATCSASGFQGRASQCGSGGSGGTWSLSPFPFWNQVSHVGQYLSRPALPWSKELVGGLYKCSCTSQATSLHTRCRTRFHRKYVSSSAVIPLEDRRKKAVGWILEPLSFRTQELRMSLVPPLERARGRPRQGEVAEKNGCQGSPSLQYLPACL